MANFSEEIISLVWEKAQKDSNNNPAVFRKDYAGAWIRRDAYGDIGNAYGWEIDHMLPSSMGGGDDINNLVPLHCQNNRRKGDNYPKWETAITSDGVKNVKEIKKWRIG